jgi:hypothetical protein
MHEGGDITPLQQDLSDEDVILPKVNWRNFKITLKAYGVKSVIMFALSGQRSTQTPEGI